MKRFNLIIAVLCCANMAFAQEAADTTLLENWPKDTIGIHPWDRHENEVNYVTPEQSHWSIFLGAGFNVFDGDYTSEKKHAVWLPSVSLAGTYHWNNTWAIGAEYKFHNYRVKGSGRECDADIMLKGMAHQADAFLTFDVFNAFRPQNKRKIFALDLILGGGAFIKKNSIYYENVRLMSKILKDTPWDYNTATQPVGKDSKYKWYGVFFGGVSAEFNINRSFQVGIRAIYNYTTSDEIDGRPYRGQNNDAIFDCEALVRYKFEPRKKSNVRNFMKDEQIDNWNDGTYYDDPALGAAKRAKYGPKTPGRDTIFSITRDTVWMAPSPVPAPSVVTIAGETYRGIRDYVVFFENDVPELDNTALSITGDAAMLLKSESEYNAVVVGSCDNTGAVEYNKWLATQRAINVSNALMEMGIDSSRIYMVGRGIMQDDRAEGSYSLNRRVEIHIVTDDRMAQEKEELSFFERYKKVKRGSAVRKVGEGKDASSSEILKKAIERMKNGEEEPENVPNEPVSETPAQQKADNNTPAESASVPSVAPVSSAAPVASSEVLEKIIVPQDATLAILAKKYYGNAKLWTVIFEANRDRMTSPDHLEAGMELIIPKLEK